MRTITPRRAGALATLVVAGLALVGCSASADAEPTAEPRTQAESVVAIDVWVAAADDGMTAAFGTLENEGAADVRVVAVESTAATAMELHETVEDDAGRMIMRQVDGFDVAPNEAFALEPGGNHLMILGLTAPIVAGDDVVLTLAFDDGSTLDVTATARDFAGSSESYESDDMGGMGGTESGSPEESGDMSGMDH